MYHAYHVIRRSIYPILLSNSLKPSSMILPCANFQICFSVEIIIFLTRNTGGGLGRGGGTVFFFLDT